MKYAHTHSSMSVHTPGTCSTFTPTKFPRIFTEPHDFQQVELEWLEKEPIISAVIFWIVKVPN